MKVDIIWQTKLHARLHDPAEKALVLLRDPEGHEGGTSRTLHRELGFQDLVAEGRLDPDNSEVLSGVLFRKGIPIELYHWVRRADWWAAGADRPQWPMEKVTVKTKSGKEKTLKVAPWAQVRWTKRPVLIHPLSGGEVDLKTLAETDITDIKRRSFDHFSRLIRKRGDAVDWRRTLLACWRFGPELAEEEDNGKLGALWPLLPADTRVPDHSIWDHLDLTSAFAGAFAADPDDEVALLALSIGPVQPFIAAARTTSDLWAGSHLLARLSWEAVKVVCERLGPDAVLFPRLRGIPQVDLWLRNEMELPEEWFQSSDWTRKATDANPLFAAALPNRFVAVVPRGEGRNIAEEVTRRVRDWLGGIGNRVVDRLLDAARLADGKEKHCHVQMRDQLDGFPEVHWAAVPFSLIRARDAERQSDLDVTELSEAMAPYFGVEPGKPCGFLATNAWQVLKKEAAFSDHTTFFAPKPGTLYPAVYDLAERLLAAAKAVRPFEQTVQEGWRCSLTGETEWLTTDSEQLKTSYRQRSDTLWAAVAANRAAWAKQGEHLGALPAIKRLWPSLFAEEVAMGLDLERASADRFVVSTHTMALAHQLERWLETDGLVTDALKDELEKAPAVALPRRLNERHGSGERFRLAKRIPALLESARDAGDEREIKRVEKLVKRGFAGCGTAGLETYYALLMMDGDRMGRILCGDERSAIRYRESFHPDVRQGFGKREKTNPNIRDYGEQRRAISPNRHLAISGALNDFALHVVPEVVEREHLGRVIYAGGDDVLAMLPVADALPAMTRLRQAYSGIHEAGDSLDWRSVRHRKGLVCKDGFAYLNGRLMRMMGERATASCGVVIAHHQAPLGAVLRELREAEQRAKNEGGRDAFSIAVIKRSGGAIHLTAKWGEAMDLLQAFRAFLAEPKVSRRAVYHSLVWLRDLPEDATEEMLGTLFGYQLARQTQSKTALDYHDVSGLARRLAELACAQPKRTDWLGRFLGIAEFLARETRSPSSGDAPINTLAHGA